MNTLLFQYVLEVEKTRSISQAAENLFMAQPNLSKAIKELEEMFQITIFSRNSKGVVPTKKGMEFLKYAANVIRQIEQMETLSLDAHSDNPRFLISIPRGSYISDAAIQLVKQLDSSHGIEISIKETNSMETIQDILSNHSELGIVRYKTNAEQYFIDYFKEKQIANHLIWDFEYLILMSKDHPLADKESITHADLSDYIEIAHADAEVPFIRHHLNDAVNKRDSKKIYVYERFSQFEFLSQMESTYMWVSPVPKEVLERYHLVQRRCSDSTIRGIDTLVYLNGFHMNDRYRTFIDKLYESRNKLAYEQYL